MIDIFFIPFPPTHPLPGITLAKCKLNMKFSDCRGFVKVWKSALTWNRKNIDAKRDEAQCLKSFFNLKTFQNAMSLASNSSLMFDLKANWNLVSIWRLPFHTGEDYANFPQHQKNSNHINIYQTQHSWWNTKKLSHASTDIMFRLDFRSPFLHCFPCLLVTYLLFLNICSRSKEHSGRLQSGQNFCESWSSGNKFSGNIFHAQFSQFSPQEGNNAL